MRNLFSAFRKLICRVQVINIECQVYYIILLHITIELSDSEFVCMSESCSPFWILTFYSEINTLQNRLMFVRKKTSDEKSSII